MFRWLVWNRNERRSRRELRGIMRDNVIITSMVILFMMYPASSTQIFELFSCKRLCAWQPLHFVLHTASASSLTLPGVCACGCVCVCVCVCVCGTVCAAQMTRHTCKEHCTSHAPPTHTCCGWCSLACLGYWSLLLASPWVHSSCCESALGMLVPCGQCSRILLRSLVLYLTQVLQTAPA